MRGERESGTKRLEEAVESYRAALQEYTRERVPLQWAMTQNNLGNALLPGLHDNFERGVDRFSSLFKLCSIVGPHPSVSHRRRYFEDRLREIDEQLAAQ